MQRSLRLRTLFLLCGIAAAALVAAVVYSVGPTAVEAALYGSLPPDRLSAAADALRGAILSAALASLLLVTPVSLWVGGFALRPLGELRAAFSRRCESAPRTTGLREVDALAAALARLLDVHRRTVAPLVTERDELAILIDSVGEGILQIGPAGRFIRANRTAREMLGLPEGIARQPVTTLVRNAELREVLEAARRGKVVEPVELALDEWCILVIPHPLDVAGGAPFPVVAVLVDLTQVRRLEGVRRDFVANASHELKTPLTSIRGYAETLLLDGEMPEDTRRQFLRTIHENAERLQRIVEDLLDLSRLEAGGWKPDLREVDVAATAEDTWRGLQQMADAKRIAFAVESDRAAALADPVAVRQILTNLLDNAIRYTPAEGRITVRIASARGARRANGHGRAGVAAGTAATRIPANGGRHDRADDSRWILTEVADTGTGIPRDALSRVFERFYRVDPARSRAEGGTGLGLAIVKHLVESMGGDVVAESELGRGTVFRFWLPAAAPASVAGRSAGSHASAS